MRLGQDRLVEIHARHAAAIPGPYGYLAPSGELVTPDLTPVAEQVTHEPTGLFLAHAWEDVATLLAEVQRELWRAAAGRRLAAAAREAVASMRADWVRDVPAAIGELAEALRAWELTVGGGGW